MTLSDVKQYLRVDFDDDDNLIQSLINTAIRYIQTQTGKQYVPTDEVWNNCIRLLVVHWYETRFLHPTRPGTLATVSHTVNAHITLISLCSDYPEIETEVVAP